MKGAWDRPWQRSLRLLVGLVLYGFGLALLVEAHLGLDPWTVLHQGVAQRTGLSIGTVTVISSVVVMALWLPLRQRPGLGTLSNALLVGPMLDLSLFLLPTPHLLVVRVACLVLAIATVAVATGLYVGAGWGPGPRDGLMTGLAAKGLPLMVARAIIEITVLVAGGLLGGQIGIGTALFAFTIGALVAWCLPKLRIRPRLDQVASSTSHLPPSLTS